MKNKKIGRLKFIKFMYTKASSARWLCLCDCGNKKIVCASSVRLGVVKSCGCLLKESARKQQRKINFKHGKTGTRIYTTYVQIKSRCYNKKDKSYKNYGARGIKCLWESFEDFYRDVGDPPSREITLDRINNNGNYCKENCKWSTKSEQAMNRRTAHMLTYKGETKNMKTWALELGISYKSLWYRIKQGWPVDKALNTK